MAERDRFEYLKRSLSIAHIMVSGDTVCPQGNSNPCRRLERAVS